MEVRLPWSLCEVSRRCFDDCGRLDRLVLGRNVFDGDSSPFAGGVADEDGNKRGLVGVFDAAMGAREREATASEYLHLMRMRQQEARPSWMLDEWSRATGGVVA